MSPPHATSPAIRALYLRPDSGPLFGLLHLAAASVRRDVAVLVVPPFGWDEVASYRSRRDWAAHLAQAGFPTLRLDLPGTGDSAGSPREDGRVDAWLEAISVAADWLREETGCERTVALGMGMGGMLAFVAASRGADVDDLVLWAARSRGRSLLRELKAFASLEGPDQGASLEAFVPLPSETAADPPPEEGHMQVGGFVLTPETIDSVKAIDLAALPLPGADRRRVLMLERDGAPVDERLRDHLEGSGAAVTVAPGPGYGEMTGDPNQAEPPLAVFDAVSAWLADGSRPAAGPASDPGEPPPVELGASGAEVRETVITIGQPFGVLFGILTEPVDRPVGSVCAVFTNAASIRRSGPNRMWVEVARRWAAEGVPTLRLDLEGLGDADGDRESAGLAALHEPGRIGQIGAALDELQARGLGPRFVLGGLCSGAFWAFHAALEDERVTAALMLNPITLFWDPATERMRELRRAVREPEMWRRTLRGEVSRDRIATLLRWLPRAPLAAARRMTARRSARRVEGDPIARAVERLGASGKHALLAFSGNEPLHDELARAGRLDGIGSRPHVMLVSLPGQTHTLRSTAAQRAAHASLDRALAAELGRAGPPHAGSVVGRAGG